MSWIPNNLYPFGKNRPLPTEKEAIIDQLFEAERYEDVKKEMRDAKNDVSDDYLEYLVLSCLARDSQEDADLVRFIANDFRGPSTEYPLIWVLSWAAKLEAGRSAAQIAAILQEQKIPTENVFREILERGKENFALDLAYVWLKKSPQVQEDLNTILLAAAHARHLPLVRRMLENGADPNSNDATAFIKLLSKNSLDMDEYLRTLAAFFEDRGAGKIKKNDALDYLFVCVAEDMAEGKQEVETLFLLLENGVDPWYSATIADGIVREKITDDKKLSTWEEILSRRRREDAAQYLQIFKTFYGDDYRAADVIKTHTEDPQSGLLLAAKARVLGEVVKKAHQEAGEGGGRMLALDHLLQEDKESGQRAIHLAEARGDLAAVLLPAYFLPEEEKVWAALDRYFTAEQKKTFDRAALAAGFSRARLEKIPANKWKLKPKLKP